MNKHEFGKNMFRIFNKLLNYDKSQLKEGCRGYVIENCNDKVLRYLILNEISKNLILSDI